MEPAIQVSPVKEEDMSFVRKVFEDMANNVVAASQLSVQVQEMARDIGELRSQIERLKNDVTYYTDQAAAFRRKSEELQHELAEVKVERDKVLADFTRTKTELERASTESEETRNHLQNVRKERDDALFRNMELEDQNKALHDKLDKVRSLTSQLFEEDKHPEPAPARQEVGADHSNPSPATEPAASPIDPRATRVIDQNDPSFNWDKPRRWDDSRHMYVQDAE